jgi:cell wall-associated NlpC family hydrolase
MQMKYTYVWLFMVGSFFASCNLHNREAREAQRNSNNHEVMVDESDGKTPNPVNVETKYELSKSEILNKYATTLKVAPNKLYNEKLYQEVDGWIGVKYKWGGVDKNGVDCSGFTDAIYLKVYEYKLPRSGYDIVKECAVIEKANLMEGDLVFFDISSKNSHVGIYLANNKFVHASSSKGVMISDLSEAYWTKYWGRAARIK